jgi:hypothetical protein
MSAFAAHFAFEFRTGVRNKMLLFLNYLATWPRAWPEPRSCCPPPRR